MVCLHFFLKFYDPHVNFYIYFETSKNVKRYSFVTKYEYQLFRFRFRLYCHCANLYNEIGVVLTTPLYLWNGFLGWSKADKNFWVAPLNKKNKNDICGSLENLSFYCLFFRSIYKMTFSNRFFYYEKCNPHLSLEIDQSAF